MMCFGLEGRVPYLDHRVVEFGFSLPDQIKIKAKTRKYLLRRWAESTLPKDHLYKRKRGFRVPLKALFRDRFLDHLEEKLVNNSAFKTWFQVEGVRELLQAHRNGRDATYEISCLMHFAISHHLFIENKGGVPSVCENPLDWIT